MHNVTIGAKGPSSDQNVPTIGDNVYIGAAATLLGDIDVGNNSVIGAGSVVTKSVGEGMIVAGNPAQNIQSDE